MPVATNSRCIGVVLAVAFTALALATTPATAQHSTFSSSWNAPAGKTGAVLDGIMLDCAAGNVTHRLFITITPTENISQLKAIDMIVDLGYHVLWYPGGGPPPAAVPLSPFWHFDDGCNAGGLVLRVPPAGEASGVSPVFPANANYMGWAYAPDFTTGRGRFSITLFHNAGLGVDLVAGRTYVVCEFDFSMCAGAGCSGCGEQLCFYPLNIRLEQDLSYADATAGLNWGVGMNDNYCNTVTAVAGGGEASQLVGFRAARGLAPAAYASQLGPAFHPVPVRTQDCYALPTVRRTWGTLKLLYR